MVIGRSLLAAGAWLGRFVGIRHQKWVEPGNAITRAVLSGAELSLPSLPVRDPVSWTEEEDAPPAPSPQEPHQVDQTAPPVGDPDDSRSRAA